MKILLIRMMGLGDVASILIPAVKIIRQRYPQIELDVMTFKAGAELMALVPEVDTIHLVTEEQWPSDLHLAMPKFIDLAEYLAFEQYDQIINFDTWFMPCFLARCLKDLNQPVSGNYVSKTMDELLSLLMIGQLDRVYVDSPWQYIESSFANMPLWFEHWWNMDGYQQLSYPEFYLNECCGLPEQVDISLTQFDKNVSFPVEIGQKVIALSTSGRVVTKQYPYTEKLIQLLQECGYYVWSEFKGEVAMETTLGRLAKTDLLITVPTSTQWLAKLVGCPSYVISGALPPSILGAELASEKKLECQYCAQRDCHFEDKFACMAVAPEEIVAAVQAYFAD